MSDQHAKKCDVFFVAQKEEHNPCFDKQADRRNKIRTHSLFLLAASLLVFMTV